MFSSLSLWRTSSPLRWVFQDTPQTGAGFGTRKASDPRFCLFFPTIIGNLLPHPNSHKLTGQINVVFLLLWQCQFYGNRWQRAQGCGAQLVCQNAMETFSAGIRLSTSSSSTQSEQANSSNAFWLHCRCSIDTITWVCQPRLYQNIFIHVAKLTLSSKLTGPKPVSQYKSGGNCWLPFYTEGLKNVLYGWESF